MRALIHIKLFASRQFSEAFNVKPKKLQPNGFAIKQTTMERRFVTCHIATKSPVERRPTRGRMAQFMIGDGGEKLKEL